ncbi:MAG TPA: endo-1,4-beta-xylanase, partial [Polyangiaceae bacterium]
MIASSNKHWLLFVLVLGLTACIRREPELAATGEAPAEQAAPATQRATGNYGKVPGEQVAAAGELAAFEPQGKTERVAVAVVDIEGQPFDTAIRAEIKEPSQQVWDVQVQAKTRTPVRKGDVLLATFHFRTEWSRNESGEGQTEFVFELARDPWTKSVSYPVRAGRAWKKIYVPFVAEESYEPGQAQIIFRLGYDPQIVEIGGVTVENFGTKLVLADLPVTRLTYPGMEPDAPWRAAAAARIEEHRKAKLDVRVEDSAGKPVSGAKVEAALKRHAFGFGTCVPAERLVGSQERFKDTVADLFNLATLENDLKWVALEGDWGSAFTLERARAGVAWLRERGIDVRGHVLVWPGWRNLPKSLKALEKEPRELRAKVKDHVHELATK